MNRWLCSMCKDNYDKYTAVKVTVCYCQKCLDGETCSTCHTKKEENNDKTQTSLD